MEIKGFRIDEFLGSTKGYVIPFYQREYTWTKKEVLQLLNDIKKNEAKSYYLGSIVIKKGHFDVTIVDGQQRISTLLLILKALSNVVKDTDLKYNINNMIEIKFNSKNLMDGKILQKIISDELLTPDDKESLYYKNFVEASKFMESIEPDKYLGKLLNIQLAYIGVDENIDEHKLFAQINSTGKKLTAFDLIKNFLFSKLESDLIDSYLEKISYVTKDMSDKEKSDYLRHFGGYNTGMLPNKNDEAIYDSIVALFYRFDSDECLVLDRMFEFGIYYNYCKNTNDKNLFYNELKTLRNSFATYSVLLVDIIRTYSEIEGYEIVFSKEQETEIQKALNVLEAYKIRRSFVNLGEKEITRFIPTIINRVKAINECAYDKKLIKILLIDANEDSMGYRMPTIREFEYSFTKEPIYNTPKVVKEFLVRLDTYDKKEIISVEEKQLTIEHIMPQKIEKWINSFNYDEQKHIEYVDTIGNLTLLAGKDNSTVQNIPFKEKQTYYRNNSFLKLNNELQDFNEWNYDTIVTRATHLFNKTSELWNIDSRYNDYDKITQDIELESQAKKLENTINREENSYKTFNKNKSYFKKMGTISISDVKTILYNLCVNGYGTEKNENEVFNVAYDGWVSQSIYKALDLEAVKIKGAISDEEFVEFLSKNEINIYHFVEYANKSIEM